MDVFGTGVAISGDYVAVGAPYENEHGYQSGAIYVFHREGTTWTEQAKLTASDADAYDNFGYKVAIHNEALTCGIHSILLTIIHNKKTIMEGKCITK